uniref:Uncharacterized protein n=1 Tax=Tanacetum cinerariifolium TaxID=118510 RepID=A0A6L2KQ74_TANCI|nr:hypothetical protein [Tanacetum cinerariifolium]
MLKTGQRARSSAGRDPGHLLSSEICRRRAPRLESTREDAEAEGTRHQYVDGVFVGQGRDVISITEPRCMHTNVDVDELESQHEVGGGSGCGGGGDDESGVDEDVGGDEDGDGSPGS